MPERLYLVFAGGKGEVTLAESCNWNQLKKGLYKKQWLVHAKQPIGSLSQVVE